MSEKQTPGSRHEPSASSTQEGTGLSRRSLLRGAATALAAAPVLSRAQAGPRVAVVGAGAFGGWAAWHLQRLGARVTLLDAWGPGNSRASSGGETRVIRAVYGPDRVYSDMVARAYPLWEALQLSAGIPLLQPTGALWMLRSEEDGYLRAAQPICAALGFPVDRLDAEAARRRWPQIRFDGVHSAWFEEKAGVLSARESCRQLVARFQAEGGDYRVAEARPGPFRNGRLEHLLLGDGSRLEADRYLFACGPWLASLFPDWLGPGLAISRQEVFFFGTPAGDEAWRPGALPVWIDFGERVFYGLPDTHGRGFKLADDTRGDPVDPTTQDRTPGAEAEARARILLAERFPRLADAPVVEGRVCQYANTPDGHLLAGPHPEAGNCWVAGGGSGHGFKLSPVLGEQVAEALLQDAPLPPEFDPGRLAAVGPARTQFD